MPILTIADCLKKNKTGLTIGNRLILPFHCEFLTIRLGLSLSMYVAPEVYTDFSPREKDVIVQEKENFTDVYFLDHRELRKELGKHQGNILIHCVEKGADIFDPKNTLRLKLTFRDDIQVVKIEKYEE